MRFIGHVPLIRLPPGRAEMALPAGRLRRVPFDEWHSFDDAYPFQAARYERTDPTFFELEMPEPVADAVECFENGRDEGAVELGRLYRALLLTTTARLPVPVLSVSYLVFDGPDLTAAERELASQVVRPRTGPCGRELIVFGEQHLRLTLDMADHCDLIAAHALLGGRCGPVEPLMHALVWTTRPGFTALNETVYLAAGLEALLVGPGEPLTATFGRRFAVLAATGDPREHEPLGRRLYALRSDFMHGRPARLTDDVEPDHRVRICRMVLRALRWFADRREEPIRGFHEVIDRAYHRSADFDALNQLLSGGTP
jgi:hypothetical protein